MPRDDTSPNINVSVCRGSARHRSSCVLVLSICLQALHTTGLAHSDRPFVLITSEARANRIQVSISPQTRQILHARKTFRPASHRLFQFFLGSPQVRLTEVCPERVMRSRPPLEEGRWFTRKYVVSRRAGLGQCALEGFLFRGLFRKAGDTEALRTIRDRAAGEKHFRDEV